MEAGKKSGEPDDGGRRLRILAAAQEQFLTHGFYGATVEGIVKAARVSKTDFYAFFHDREAVFLDVARNLTVLQGQQFALIDGELPDQLSDAAFRIREGQVNSRSLGIFRAAIAATRLSPSLGREVYLSRAASVEDFASYLDDLKRSKLLSFDDAHLAVLRFSFLATDGLRHLAGLPLPDQAERESHAQHTADMFLHGTASRLLWDHPEHQCTALQGVLTNMPILPPPALPATATRLSDEAWENVLQIAWEEFRDNGYSNASMEMIGKKSGLPKNTIYRKFESKAGILVHTCQRIIHRTFFRNPEISSPTTSARKTLIAMAGAVQSHFCSADMRTMHEILIVEAGHNPSTTSTIYEHLVDAISQWLAPVMETLVEAGLIRGSSGGLAWEFFTLSTFGSRFLFVQPDPDKENALATEAVDTFLFGLKKPRDFVRPT